jgi:hypothetical protein
MRHPGTKQHTSKVMHVAHDRKIANHGNNEGNINSGPGVFFNVRLTVVVYCCITQMWRASRFRVLREKSNSQLRYTRFVQEVGVLLKQLLKQLCA